MYPCPRCHKQFIDTDDLINHALQWHSQSTLIGIIRKMRQLIKNDFIQIDSQWIFALGAFHLSLTPNTQGNFSLHVYGSIEPIPKATLYPTEPEWDKALILANKFMQAYIIAIEQEGL